MANYEIPTYPTRRLRYYNNQFLKDQDFIDDQSHQLAMAQAQLRSLCVAGVCEGLTVRLDAAGKLQIAPGLAIDAAGHLIAMDAEKAGPDASPLADGGYLLHVTFAEEEDAMAPPIAGGSQGYTRWTQKPLFGATPQGSAVPAGAVVLGTFTVAQAAVTAVSDAGRQYSGIRFPGPGAGAGAATLANRSDGSADGLRLGGDLTMRRDVSGGKLGPTLTLTNGVTYPGGASSGAAIDFNAYDPGVNAPALRLQAVGDNAGSSHLAISTKQPGAATNNLVERLRITSLGVLQFPNEARDKILVSDGYGLGSGTGNLALFCPPAGRLSLRQNSSSGAEVFTVSGAGAATFAGGATLGGGVTVTGNVAASGSLSGSALSATGNVTAGGSLSGNSLQVSGNATITGNLEAYGNLGASYLVYGGQLQISGPGSITGVLTAGELQCNRAIVSGPIVPKVGNDANSGIQFPSNPGGGSGDEAFLRYSIQAGETTKLTLGINNDADDALVLWQGGAERIVIANNSVAAKNDLNVTGALSSNSLSSNSLQLNGNGIITGTLTVSGNLSANSLSLNNISALSLYSLTLETMSVGAITSNVIFNNSISVHGVLNTNSLSTNSLSVSYHLYTDTLSANSLSAGSLSANSLSIASGGYLQITGGLQLAGDLAVSDHLTTKSLEIVNGGQSHGEWTSEGLTVSNVSTPLLNYAITSANANRNGIYTSAGYGGSNGEYALYADAYWSTYAGYFQGRVHVNGHFSKSSSSFMIDHPLDPLNKYLIHSAVESSDMMNVYNGIAVCDGQGNALVQLPEWFEAVNSDYRYQLTPVGAAANLHVATEIERNSFVIGGGTEGLKVSWQVTGIRRDPWALRNRLPVEREKQGEARGRYLQPELYGQPAERGIHYQAGLRREPAPDDPARPKQPGSANTEPPRS